MTHGPWRAIGLGGLLTALLALGIAPISQAADIDPSVVKCIRDALGPDAARILSGNEKAMARLAPKQRGRLEGCLLTNGRSSGPAAKLPPALSVSPMDPQRVTQMSKFRSCAGHDYSGMNVEGKPERNRSMKHYLYVDRPWTATGSVPIVAPFPGTVIVSVEDDYPLGSWVRILHRNGWAFTAFHVEAKVRDGQQVQAGQEIATFPPANAAEFMPERMGEPEANFDFTLQSRDGRITSFLDWLTPAAGAPWLERGFTAGTLAISRAERDAQPCPKGFPDGPGSSGFVAGGTPS